MKKILSALISLIMLFSIVSVTPVMADSISGTYTFVDTCYSPELGIYVAVAKDLSSGTTPAQIYVSDNGYDWTLKKTLSHLFLDMYFAFFSMKHVLLHIPLDIKKNFSAIVAYSFN